MLLMILWHSNTVNAKNVTNNYKAPYVHANNVTNTYNYIHKYVTHTYNYMVY